MTTVQKHAVHVPGVLTKHILVRISVFFVPIIKKQHERGQLMYWNVKVMNKAKKGYEGISSLFWFEGRQACVSLLVVNFQITQATSYNVSNNFSQECK